MNRKEAVTLLLTTLLILSLSVAEFTSIVKANPLPAINPIIKIGNPQNTTYNANTINLNFTASFTWISSSVYYSIDNSDKIALNTTTVLVEDANIGKNPSISRITVEGSHVISNVSKGWHNITLYLICEDQIFSYYETYHKGDVIDSESVGFFVSPPIINFSAPISFTIIEVSAPIVTFAIAICLLLYYKQKRKNSISK